MSKKVVDETLSKIEETQEALRHSIAETKELAAQSEKLIKLHRKQLDKSVE